jgi:hypothetical protein
LGKWWTKLHTVHENTGDGDDEFWTANKVNILLQMNAAIS